MNADTQLDNVSATFPADVYGSKLRSQRYVFSGSYEQPMTGWWSQKLTLSRAQEASRCFFRGPCSAISSTVLQHAVRLPE